MRLRILLLTHSYTPDVSPPQRRWEAFSREFSARGHFIDIVAPESEGKRSFIQGYAETAPNGVQIHRFSSIRKSSNMFGKLLKHAYDALRSFSPALGTPRPQVVVATVPALPTLAVGYLVSKMRRVPFVVDLRDAWPDLLQESQVLRLRWLEPIVSSVISSMIRRSDLVVTVTFGLARKLMDSGARRAITISNGVDIDKPRMKVETIHRGEHLRVLYLGNLGKSQGLDLVIRAAAELKAEIELRIVGQGTEKQNLQELAGRLGVEVDFRGPVYGHHVLENYAWADTSLVSLRSDWGSFEHTIPSKLYELLFLDRHITGLVKGEAAEIIRASASGEVVEQSESALIEHFRKLCLDRSALRTEGAGSTWVRENASLSTLGQQFAEEIENLISDLRRRK